ncbi:MAG: dihydroorotase [Micrococcales bacterium]|nr:dihydroorotase [Micrococcales bacterium]
MTSYLIKNAQLPTGEHQDLLLDNGSIHAINPHIPPPKHAHTIDADGLIALPGLVDLHTHLREPGGHGETVLTGSRAAAAGGFTCVHAMANTFPVQDRAGVVDQVHALGERAGYVEVRPVGAVSEGLEGEKLAGLAAMARSAAAVRVFSDDGHCVFDPVLMRRALEYTKAFDAVVAQHAQEPRLTEGSLMHEGVVSAELGLTGWPAVAEESIIARDVLLAEHVGSRLHVCHVSTRGSVEILRWAKSRGIDVTAEVTPHHLLLTDECARGYDPVFKVNPPLRSDDDVAAVREALAEGVIDIVATDHAPHPTEAKECEWAHAAFGMVGLETALPIVHEVMVTSGLMTWADVARTMAELPARIGRVTGQGAGLAPGGPANLTLFDPAARWVVDPTRLATASQNSPVRGREMQGKTLWTFFRGVATLADGELVDLGEEPS